MTGPDRLDRAASTGGSSRSWWPRDPPRGEAGRGRWPALV